MAKDKRVSVDSIDMNNESGMSNEQRSKLPMNISGVEKRLQKRKKAM